MTSSKKFPSSRDTYDAFAPFYREYSRKKSSYIEAIDALILSNLPRKTSSILDIGCGDGVRFQRLLERINFERALAMDSSSEMVSLAKLNTRAVVVLADIGNSDIDAIVPIRFDVILCLWNVLGHIEGSVARERAILNMSQALNDVGRIYIDVSNRHNVSHYGWKTVLKNIATDLLNPNRNNGTLTYDIQVAEDKSIEAHSHFFNPNELLALFKRAGLNTVMTAYVNYGTGKEAGPWSGSIFYVLERAKNKNAG